MAEGKDCSPEYERMMEPFVDRDYDSRRGFDEDFLGIHLPLPQVADLSVASKMRDGSHIIPYEHFSIALHKERKLALLTCANVDASKERRKPDQSRDYTRRGLSGLGKNDKEKWLFDPRIEEEHQLPDRFYTRDRGNFDKGHIVRRIDVAWGDTYNEVRRANGDTYHVTNCSPQVDAFNRAGKRGEWGRLENFVAKQAKAERLCLYAGPVLDDDNDRVFHGRDLNGDVVVQIPSLFWKIVVARSDNRLETFAFLLEQDLSDTDVEFNVDAEWQSRMITIPELEELVPDILFPEPLRKGDQANAQAGDAIRNTAKLERYQRGPSRSSRSRPPEVENSMEDQEKVIWADDTAPDYLAGALEAGNHALAGALLDALEVELRSTGRRIQAGPAKKVLAALRKHTWFEKLRSFAELFEEFAQDDHVVIRQLAQARIELGDITQAVEILLKSKESISNHLDAADDPGERDHLEHELGEAMGLLGRAYKQYYIDARPTTTEPRSSDLKKAMEYYRDAYEKRLGDYKWHGMNYVALLTKRERVETGKRNKISAKAEKHARRILLAIDNLEEPLNAWDLANRIEANLAIGETVQARDATMAYLDCAGLDAFSVQSTRRQLIELWMLTEEEPPGSVILPLLTARLAELGGGGEVVELNPAALPAYEKVWGITRYKSLEWLKTAIERSSAVARLGPNKYVGDGTGFLIDGAWIEPELAGKPLLITNAHVCSDDPQVQEQFPYPVARTELKATFLAAANGREPEEIAFTRVIASSPPSELDFTLLELDKMPDGAKLPTLCGRSPPVTERGDSRLNIIGHPRGRDLKVSLQDNKTVKVGEKYVHYRTPTDPGSSGSPVFNQKWELVALHHSSSAAMHANEGVRIDLIIERIRNRHR